jgi:hypothetical protein
VEESWTPQAMRVTATIHALIVAQLYLFSLARQLSLKLFRNSKAINYIPLNFWLSSSHQPPSIPQV